MYHCVAVYLEWALYNSVIMSCLINLNGRKNSKMTTLAVLLRFVPECEEQPALVAPYLYKTFIKI